MAILLDSSFYIALIDEKSPFHSRAKKLLYFLHEMKFGKVYTTELIFGEVISILNYLGEGKLPELLFNLSSFFYGEDPIAEMLKIKADDYTPIIAYLAEHSHSELIVNFTDASSAILCQKQQIMKIVTFKQQKEEIFPKLQIIS